MGFSCFLGRFQRFFGVAFPLWAPGAAPSDGMELGRQPHWPRTGTSQTEKMGEVFILNPFTSKVSVAIDAGTSIFTWAWFLGSAKVRAMHPAGKGTATSGKKDQMPNALALALTSRDVLPLCNYVIGGGCGTLPSSLLVIRPVRAEDCLDAVCDHTVRSSVESVQGASHTSRLHVATRLGLEYYIVSYSVNVVLMIACS